jgi:lambda family phage portal protein
MATIVDRVIGWLSPQAGLNRFFARERLERAYEAASPRDPWKPRRAGASANADHFMDARTIRAKVRALEQNVPYVVAGLEGLVSSTVGTGIMPRATGKDAVRLNELYAKWMPQCDADGQLDFHGLVALAYRTMERDGEVLIRLRPRRISDGIAVPLQLQVLEIDWLDSYKTGMVDGNQVINGIEYDALGSRIAYWLYDQHPGEIAQVSVNRSVSRRIPARAIIHLFNPKRPGQGRGISRFASVVTRVRDLQLYEDAELQRKNLETRLSVLASGDATLLENPAGTGQASGGAAATGQLGELASGSITQVPSGVNLTIVEPKAAPGYAESVKLALHLIAVGIGVPYEMLTGDMVEVNFSSARVRLLDFRRSVQQMQWLTIIPKLLIPIHTAFVDAAYMAGEISKPDYSVDFSPPKFDYVNPEQDVKAEQAEIAVGLATVSEKLRQRGEDPARVFAERAAEIKKMKELGIFDVSLFLQRGSLTTKQDEGLSEPATTK